MTRTATKAAALLNWISGCNAAGESVVSDWTDARLVERLIAQGLVTYEEKLWLAGGSMPPSYVGLRLTELARQEGRCA